MDSDDKKHSPSTSGSRAPSKPVGKASTVEEGAITAVPTPTKPRSRQRSRTTTGTTSLAKSVRNDEVKTYTKGDHLQSLRLLQENVKLQIKDLSPCQVRSVPVNNKVVARYAEWGAQSSFPKIIVLKDKNGVMRIADGHHRCQAAVNAGHLEITADVYTGSDADARIIGREQNNLHGLSLTLSEKLADLDERLASGDESLDNSTLARLTGLDRHTVAKRRKLGRFSNDFKRDKTSEERLESASRTIARCLSDVGAEALSKALEKLPASIHEEIRAILNP